MNGSDWTPEKENAFREYLRVMAVIVLAIQLKWDWAKSWFYFDMTAGRPKKWPKDRLE
jgi:hypothetical protein